jgi:hypothetical protein
MEYGLFFPWIDSFVLFSISSGYNPPSEIPGFFSLAGATAELQVCISYRSFLLEMYPIRLSGFPLESIIPLDMPTVIADDALDTRTGLVETHTLGVFFLYSFCHDFALRMSLAWINDLTDYALLFAIWMRSCCIRFTLDTALGWKRKGSHPLPGGLGVVSHCHDLAVRIRPQGSILFSVPGSDWFLRFSSNVFGSRILRCDPSLRRGVY